MNDKIKTITLQGKSYAPVKERVKAFREENPNGAIETIVETIGDGYIKVRATVTKEIGNDKSAMANGHSFGNVKNQKQFEKLESVAVGRALAFLGYLADGEIASSDEMEEFLNYKEKKKNAEFDRVSKEVKEINDVEKLRKYYGKNTGLGKEIDEIIKTRADELKKKNVG